MGRLRFSQRLTSKLHFLNQQNLASGCTIFSRSITVKVMWPGWILELMTPDSLPTALVSRFQDLFIHLSGLQSKQDEAQLLQDLLHTRIYKTKKQKAGNGNTQSCISLSPSKLSMPLSHGDIDMDTHTCMHIRTALNMNNQNQNSSMYINLSKKEEKNERKQNYIYNYIYGL